MAKVTIINTREHEITLSARDKNGVIRSVDIPRAKPDPVDPKEPLVFGTAEIEGELLGEAKKKPAVAAYFDNGWLKIQKGAAGKADTAKADTNTAQTQQ